MLEKVVTQNKLWLIDFFSTAYQTFLGYLKPVYSFRLYDFVTDKIMP